MRKSDLSVTYHNDIPLNVAIAAYNGTSFSPDRSGQNAVSEYAETLTRDFDMLSVYADTDEKKDTLAAEFDRYREGYKARMLKYLHSRNGLMTGQFYFGCSDGHLQSQWSFVATCTHHRYGAMSHQTNRVWIPTIEGRDQR